MTKPIPSHVEYKEHKYTILGIFSAPISIFELIGITPNSFSTAGNSSVTYSVQIQKEQFLIKDIHILHNVTKDELSNMPSLNGVCPIGGFFDKHDKTWSVSYNNVGLLAPISGYVTIGRNIVSDYEFSMLPSLPRMYEIVIRLNVLDGLILSIEDLSKRAKVVREAEIKINKEWQALYEVDKTISYGDYKKEERQALFAEERCIEDPNECDE